MFTGLVEGVGTIVGIRPAAGGGAVLQIDGGPLTREPYVLGESIAVNGACLTVTASSGAVFSVDVSPETLERTIIGHLRPGARVNLERALRLSDRLGGHLVSGHIDCVGRLSEMGRAGNARILRFIISSSVLRYVIEKGSICIDGISLTVNELHADGFSVSIIPHTLSETTLAGYRPGQEVNIETDLIGKYVERLFSPGNTAEQGVGGRGLSLDFLAKNGFL